MTTKVDLSNGVSGILPAANMEGGGGGGGATGGGTDKVFFEGDAFISQSFTIGSGSYRSGVTVSLTTPAVFVLSSHLFTAGQPIHLRTTGVLPTGFAVDTVYYVSSVGLASNTFQLSATPGGASIAATGSQSGVHSVGKIKNAVSPGPVTVSDSATVTVESGSTWIVT